MEKTDTIILSPEELAAYMAESTIKRNKYIRTLPLVILMVDDTVIGTLGNFMASIRKAKAENFQRFSHCRIGIEWHPVLFITGLCS